MTLVVKSRERDSARAGTQALTLLSTPIVAGVLEALAAESRPLAELSRQVGSPPQTTMRGYLRTLTDTGVVTKRRENDFPGTLTFELTPVGHDLWTVTEVLRAWLALAPHGPVQLGSIAAKSAVKALVEGWATSIMRALAARPLSLTELSAVIPGIRYPSLERRIRMMRMVGQIEKAPGGGPGTPYAATEWLSLAIAPLAAAARWERIHVPSATAPISRLDVEAALLLTIPLLKLRPDLSGACRLVVELQAGDSDRLGGVLVNVEEGRISSCATQLRAEADAWASGSVNSWLRTVIERDTHGLEIGGDCGLARALLDGLYETLFGALQAGQPDL